MFVLLDLAKQVNSEKLRSQWRIRTSSCSPPSAPTTTTNNNRSSRSENASPSPQTSTGPQGTTNFHNNPVKSAQICLKKKIHLKRSGKFSSNGDETKVNQVKLQHRAPNLSETSTDKRSGEELTLGFTVQWAGPDRVAPPRPALTPTPTRPGPTQPSHQKRTTTLMAFETL